MDVAHDALGREASSHFLDGDLIALREIRPAGEQPHAAPRKVMGDGSLFLFRGAVRPQLPKAHIGGHREALVSSHVARLPVEGRVRERATAQRARSGARFNRRSACGAPVGHRTEDPPGLYIHALESAQESGFLPLELAGSDQRRLSELLPDPVAHAVDLGPARRSECLSLKHRPGLARPPRIPRSCNQLCALPRCPAKALYLD